MKQEKGGFNVQTNKISYLNMNRKKLMDALTKSIGL